MTINVGCRAMKLEIALGASNPHRTSVSGEMSDVKVGGGGLKWGDFVSVANCATGLNLARTVDKGGGKGDGEAHVNGVTNDNGGVGKVLSPVEVRPWAKVQVYSCDKKKFKLAASVGLARNLLAIEAQGKELTFTGVKVLDYNLAGVELEATPVFSKLDLVGTPSSGASGAESKRVKASLFRVRQASPIDRSSSLRLERVVLEADRAAELNLPRASDKGNKGSDLFPNESRPWASGRVGSSAKRVFNLAVSWQLAETLGAIDRHGGKLSFINPKVIKVSAIGLEGRADKTSVSLVPECGKVGSAPPSSVSEVELMGSKSVMLKLEG
ncbi:hypothetical protein RBU55_18550 [Pseudomonas chlororaphis subsp. aurantiaca]|uniref:hypothetical protein n=1 Tax=Pseudomonas chlororaphis TaxID=587753 RepID=UPI0027DE49FD|nr:hypothetical protein [Pseudomonas chlororaphis]WMI97567.1 hypothetical protein RBU55_18550 [Pseudomonas chlororaphis subsp. aurantiaca]